MPKLLALGPTIARLLLKGRVVREICLEVEYHWGYFDKGHSLRAFGIVLSC